MGKNLKNRLQHIRNLNPGKTQYPLERKEPASGSVFSAQKSILDSIEDSLQDSGDFPGSAWITAGHQVLKRTVKTNLPLPVPSVFPNSLAIAVPDFLKYCRMPVPEDLVFFDLETTGLSGGAGTLAFLGSFGRFRTGGIVIEQYLLLDYPGEGDFLEALMNEFAKSKSPSNPVLIVSYNGKTFDSQIFKNRCLMNGIVPPDYFHADLLHPSRRLWKKILPDCSQGTIETAVLGLDRMGDVPGALAPEIWFSFLKTGQTQALTGICDHNIKDIRGLASICLLLAKITSAPIKMLDTCPFDFEALALLWRETARYRSGLRSKLPGKHFMPEWFSCEEEKTTAAILLAEAARRLMPRSLYVLGLDLLKTDTEQGRYLLAKLLSSAVDAADDLKALALRALAMDALYRLRNLGTALEYTESALALPGIKKSLKEDLEHRKERLNKKILPDKKEEK